MESLASAQANAYNVGRMVEDVEYYKQKMKQIKETLVRERTKGQQLKRKYDDTLSEFERLREACQAIELDNDALILLSEITKGEKRDLESKVSDLETQKKVANQRPKELETQNNLLDKKLKVANEKHANVTPFHIQACLL